MIFPFLPFVFLRVQCLLLIGWREALSLVSCRVLLLTCMHAAADATVDADVDTDLGTSLRFLAMIMMIMFSVVAIVVLVMFSSTFIVVCLINSIYAFFNLLLFFVHIKQNILSKLMTAASFCYCCCLYMRCFWRHH